MSRKTLSVGAAALVAAVLAVLAGCATTQTVKPATDEELKAKRDSAQQYYSFGAGYFSQGNFESALENFQRALTYDSTYYEVYVAIGTAYRKMLDPVSAEENFRAAMRLDPKKAKAYEGLGDLFLAMQKDSAALAVYLEGLAQDSSLVDLYSGAADVYLRWKQMDKARQLYESAMRRFPDDVNVQRLWADFLYKQGLYADAANSLLPLVQRFSKVWELREKLADCYIELKQYDKAVAQLDTILQSEPNRDQTALRQGSVYLASGKTKQAIKVFDALIAKDSTKTQPRVFKAEALIQQGSTGAAEDILQKVLRMEPGNAQALADLGEIRYKQAREQAGSNLTATPTAKLRRSLALCDEAIGYYNKALSDPVMKQYAGKMLVAVGDLKKVVEKELFVR
ncbi:tetratricopeptide repeat protein [candidate division WOR-3 bacterium]|uniref:Tetratricopeptide repeat protein n=1 Tax=candidate division WOR-3 bacterium TaxID=2052148 RepID=A0A937XGM0_UNCW3|nr:tetratricopeptide repeat protein [candidate division WOR-3 bacterium]